MSGILIALTVALGLVSTAAAAKKPGKVEAAVRQAERHWASATIKGDAAALERLLADDLTYTHSSARTETKGQFIEALNTGTMKYEAIDYDEIVVRVYGRTAVVTANPKVRLVSRGQPASFQVRILHVWVKGPGGWQMAAHQSTRLNP